MHRWKICAALACACFGLALGIGPLGGAEPPSAGSADRGDILSSEAWRKTMREFDEWATVQKIYDAGQIVPGGAERRPFSGSPQAIADDIGVFAGLGVSELIFDFRSPSLTESLERMERFATTVMPGGGEA